MSGSAECLTQPPALSSPPGLGIILIDLITEQAPAISLAYEPAEASVMERPPRDMKRDRLASWPVIRYAYLIAGPWQAVLALIAYLIVFWEHNICIADYVAFSGTHHFQPQPHNNRPFTTRSGLLVTGADQSNLLGQAQAGAWQQLACVGRWSESCCDPALVLFPQRGGLPSFSVRPGTSGSARRGSCPSPGKHPASTSATRSRGWALPSSCSSSSSSSTSRNST